MQRPRIVLAEDNSEMREKLQDLLESQFDVVGSVADGLQAIDSALKFEPDILVSDISMPILNGLKAGERLRDLGCSAKLIFVTVHDDEDYRDAAFSIGAFGYVLKARVDTDLLPAIAGALQGQRFPSHFPAPQS